MRHNRLLHLERHASDEPAHRRRGCRGRRGRRARDRRVEVAPGAQHLLRATRPRRPDIDADQRGADSRAQSPSETIEALRPLRIAFYISGHGLGHASRSAELIDALLRRHSTLTVVVRTSVRASAFDRLSTPRVTLEPCDTDTGVAQIDSLHVDVEETARRAAAFHREFDRRVADETRRLRHLHTTIVISDAPPIAIAAAHLAGIPAVVVANFTWDWIYAFYPEFETLAPGVIERTALAYSTAALALRLPIAGGFESMTRVVRDIPLIARRSRRNREETRRLLGIDSARPSVLSSFGVHGLVLPYERVERSGLTVLAPESPPAGLYYEDLVAAVDAVVSKPGYGIVSECAANGTPLLYTPRGRFAEYDVMVGEMPRLIRCRRIAQPDLLNARWQRDLDALLAMREPREPPGIDGASVAASMILDLA